MSHTITGPCIIIVRMPTSPGKLPTRSVAALRAVMEEVCIAAVADLAGAALDLHVLKVFMSGEHEAMDWFKTSKLDGLEYQIVELDSSVI